MYRKVMMQSYMMQSYLSEDVCKKFYVKVVFRNYNFPKKIKIFAKKETNMLSQIPRWKSLLTRALISCPTSGGPCADYAED